MFSEFYRRVRVSTRTLLFAALFLVLFVFSVVPAFAQATIEFDPTVLFDNANIWIPVILGIFAIPFGISIAANLVTAIGNAIVAAIRGAFRG